MSAEIIGLVGLAVLVVLLVGGMWIGFAMALVGFLGFAIIGGLEAALGVLGTVPYSTVAHYGVSVVPFFLLMGIVASTAGISEDLYETAQKWLGRFPGGLAIATVAACAGFAGICGSSVAEAAAMSKVAIREMRKYGYDPKLASGSVAVGGTLGILIPPSVGFIVYGILTQQPIGKLFVAGIVPGLLLTLLLMVEVFILCKVNSSLGPPGPKSTFKEKVMAMKYTWPVLFLFLIVMGGMYLGVFTPTEAGAIGAFGMSIVAAIKGRRNFINRLLGMLLEVAQITGMVFILLIGAMIFNRFLSISNLPMTILEIIHKLNISKHVFIAVVIVLYIVLGMFLEVLSSLALTLPIVFPAAVTVGFDPIWFGVIIVILCEIGLITPPVGMNLFVISGASREPIDLVARGSAPFIVAMLFCIILLCLFPQMVLFLPNMMG